MSLADWPVADQGLCQCTCNIPARQLDRLRQKHPNLDRSSQLSSGENDQGPGSCIEAQSDEDYALGYPGTLDLLVEARDASSNRGQPVRHNAEPCQRTTTQIKHGAQVSMPHQQTFDNRGCALASLPETTTSATVDSVSPQRDRRPRRDQWPERERGEREWGERERGERERGERERGEREWPERIRCEELGRRSAVPNSSAEPPAERYMCDPRERQRLMIELMIAECATQYDLETDMFLTTAMRIQGTSTAGLPKQDTDPPSKYTTDLLAQTGFQSEIWEFRRHEIAIRQSLLHLFSQGELTAHLEETVSKMRAHLQTAIRGVDAGIECGIELSSEAKANTVALLRQFPLPQFNSSPAGGVLSDPKLPFCTPHNLMLLQTAVT